MNRVLILLSIAVCLTFSIAAQAQDNAYVGTWKLNTTKSKAPAGKMPRDMTRTVEGDPSAAKYHSVGEDADGNKVDYSFTTKYDGQDGKVEGTGMPLSADTVAIKRVTSHKVTAILKKDGKVIAHSTSIVSADGKTTTITLTLEDGTAGSTSVYEKQ